MASPADLALVGPLAFLALVALNALLLRRHAGSLVEALLGRGHAPRAVEGRPPGESNVVALRPAPVVRPSARPALRLAA